MNYFLLYALILFPIANQTHAQSVFTIKMDGSSTVFPISEAIAEEYQKIQQGKTRVTVGISGTGGGFKKFCRGETHLQNASRPISKEETQNCAVKNISFYELPIAYDAITLVVHAQNNWIDEISLNDLKRIWEPVAEGKITKWNDINPQYPDSPLQLYGAGSDSGTFDYFSEVIVGKAKSSRSDYTASEDDNTLIQGVIHNKFALGYVPFSYYFAHKDKLKALKIKNNKTSVAPSFASIEDGSYAPLSRPIFIYVNKDAANTNKTIKEFTQYYLTNAATAAKDVNYVPLNAATYVLTRKIFDKQISGALLLNQGGSVSNLQHFLEKITL